MVTLTPRTTLSFSHSGVSVISAESLVLIKISDEINIGGCVLEDGWCQLTAQDPTYPWDVPLYKSPQFDVGCVEFDPCTVTGTQRPSLSDGGVKKFNIKVNVWFCPAKTNCGIHNVHTKPEMLEVDFLPQNNVYSPLPPPPNSSPVDACGTVWVRCTLLTRKHKYSDKPVFGYFCKHRHYNVRDWSS